MKKTDLRGPEVANPTLDGESYTGHTTFHAWVSHLDVLGDALGGFALSGEVGGGAGGVLGVHNRFRAERDGAGGQSKAASFRRH